MQLITTAPTLSKSAGYMNRLSNCLRIAKNKTITEWTIDQLDIRPYQHILEIGYASGYTLQEVARKLKIGFLAGIDSSITMYRQSYKRNKKLIQDQLLQLHIGSAHELPYPHYYFHTIYANDFIAPGKESQQALMQLSNMLRIGGRLVMVSRLEKNSNEEAALEFAEKIKQDYLQSGLQNIQIEWHDMGMAVIGYRE
ncbi:MAG: methyltransferase domain-containing protein [Bacteroidetes bacterium]|nr:methyltransferase domain-containing protein [Bacteroidota bacterium]